MQYPFNQFVVHKYFKYGPLQLPGLRMFGKWLQKLDFISVPVSADFPQIVSGLRRRKKSEKWHAYFHYLNHL